jgi:hypothetical protein
MHKMVKLLGLYANTFRDKNFRDCKLKQNAFVL